MVFSSILFLFVYLPVVLAVYYIVPARYRNLWLFIVNLVFYGWGEPVYILLMVFSIALNYAAGLLIARYKLTDDKKARAVLTVNTVVNLALLIFFKYFDLLAATLSRIPGISIPALGLTLPIGISFYTFQTMSYPIDVYRGDTEEQKNFIRFGTFVALFPQLIAGPIVRYKDVASQLGTRRLSSEQFSSGVQRFAIGLGKKVLLANNIGALWDIYAAAPELSFAGAWLGALAFSLQLYFDFSGYSLMALGAAELLGLQLTTNFDTPYFSRSIREFWGRWHISFSSWLKDYVYIPLGGNRKGKARKYLNLLLTFLVSGVWHGVGLTYLIWGALHGVYQIAGDATDRLRGRVYAALHISRTGRLACAWQCLCTFALVNAAWVFFRAASVHDALYVLTAQFRNVSLTGLLADIRAIAASFNAKSLLSAAFLAFVLLALAGGVLLDCARRFKAPGGDLSARMLSLPLIFRWLLYYALAAFIFAGFLMNNGYFATAANFLYNNF